MLPDAQAGEYNSILRDFSVTVDIKNAVKNRSLNIKRKFERNRSLNCTGTINEPVPQNMVTYYLTPQKSVEI